MAYQNPLPSTEPEKKEAAPPLSDTRPNLDKLGQDVSNKQNISTQIGELLRNFGNLSGPERMQKIGAILSIATLGYIFGKPKESAEQPKKGARRKKSVGSEPASDQETREEVTEETAKELTPRERRRKVVCADKRLICINTSPIQGRGPAVTKEHSSYLLEYGLPDYDTFKEEMIGFLAPDSSGDEAVKKATELLASSPMGKYQCMPRYLFPMIGLPFEGEEGLQAMHKFLQSEELQRNACRAYIQKTGTTNPRYVAAAYYGGNDEIAKIKAIEEGQATEKQKHEINRDQSGYPSIWKYATAVEAGYQKRAKGNGFDMEAMLDAIAGQESGKLEGEKAKSRDEGWERDQRFAYNRTAQKETNERIV